MGKRILVADDSLTIQKAFAMVLAGSEYSVTFAKSVDEALAAARADGKPDLVLSDAILGNGSGYDLCAAIKAEPSLHNVLVYILASLQTPYDETRGRKVGADGHLAKPFESQGLLDALSSVLTAPVTLGPAVMPQVAVDYDDNTARITDREAAEYAARGEDRGDDDDNYGEIVIERSPATPASAPAWNARPAKRPPATRPPATQNTPAPPSSPRPSLIPGTRPSASMPAVRSGMTPSPTQSLPPAAVAAARPLPNRTMMGFPSAKPSTAAKPSPGPLPQRPGSPAPAMAHTPSLAVPGPAPQQIPSLSRLAPTPPLAAAATPAAPTTMRLTVPRIAAPAAPAPVSAPSSVPPARQASTPLPMSTPPGGGASAQPVRSALASVVSSAVDQKVATLAARGPEYEAIAKLSREIIEQVVWEVVPELAEVIIRQEIDRLALAKK